MLDTEIHEVGTSVFHSEHGKLSQATGALRPSNTDYFQYCKFQQRSREYSAFTVDMSCRNAVVNSYQKVSSDSGQPSAKEPGTINTFSLHCKPSGRNGQYEGHMLLSLSLWGCSACIKGLYWPVLSYPVFRF